MSAATPCRRLFASLLFSLCLPFLASAQVILLNPGDDTGLTAQTGSTPYAVSSPNNFWNNGTTSYGTIFYSNGTTQATGVTVLGDSGGISSGTGGLNFTSSPIGSAIGGSTSGVLFGADPAKDAVVTNTSNSTLRELFGLRIHGLALNTTYEVYVVAAYTAGGFPASQPGNTAARQAVFGFAGALSDTLTYTASGGGATITATGVSTSSYQALTNANNTAWVENNNFEKFQVTLTADNPTLYIVTTGDKSLAGLSTGSSTEERGWLNLVQIVTVPEPGPVGLLIATATLGLITRRRRRPCR
jgi:hypothetical protein